MSQEKYPKKPHPNPDLKPFENNRLLYLEFSGGRKKEIRIKIHSREQSILEPLTSSFLKMCPGCTCIFQNSDPFSNPLHPKASKVCTCSNTLPSCSPRQAQWRRPTRHRCLQKAKMWRSSNNLVFVTAEQGQQGYRGGCVCPLWVAGTSQRVKHQC